MVNPFFIFLYLSSKFIIRLPFLPAANYKNPTAFSINFIFSQEITKKTKKS